MKTGSLRLRVSLVTLLVLTVVLGGVVAATTLAYRSGLQSDLRRQLTAAALGFEQAWPSDNAKQLVIAFALEGIATEVQRRPVPVPAGKSGVAGSPPIKPGVGIASRGSLFVLGEQLSDGTRVTFSASLARIGHSVRRLLLLEIAVALAALALAALALRLATAAAVRPLTEVAETATRIAAGETSRLNPTREDTELGKMAAAFDRMVASLESAVTKAQSSESAMRRFLADASHELRTPVAALQANAETLLREQPSRPERDRIEARLASDAARLGRLVDDLLNLARIEASGPSAGEVVDLAAVTSNSVQEVGGHSNGTEVDLTHAEEARVLGDIEALSRALRNVLENAVAAAGPGGHVAIAVQRSETQAELRILDDGPGITEADRARIFDRFVRLDPANAPGSGLGLAIARQIVRQHGGEITCDAVAQGASFTFRLPLYNRGRATIGRVWARRETAFLMPGYGSISVDRSARSDS